MAQTQAQARWNKENRPHLREYGNEYREKNRVRLREMRKSWCEKNKEIIKQKRRAYYAANSAHIAEYQKSRRAKYKDRIRDQLIGRTHGLSPQQYATLLERQGGVCAICKLPPDEKRLVVDHCHSTNMVRGLIHKKCNSAIGMLNDDPKLLLAAAAYLQESLAQQIKDLIG